MTKEAGRHRTQTRRADTDDHHRRYIKLDRYLCRPGDACRFQSACRAVLNDSPGTRHPNCDNYLGKLDTATRDHCTTGHTFAPGIDAENMAQKPKRSSENN
ncbi:hypothetical protein HPP92_028811 [Vanilla planifolia]|uniref:Uncharacterized protein n=1 Tax=Vanilla planifolia TaxID=51239 RepID=A0A835U2I5_VANPL|nr:hypothetical protein HPP92_028811 [Vanilla planifolia]KAG0446483.1 hypothetical protein HPP92_028800 [Vanilla planifolia]